MKNLKKYSLLLLAMVTFTLQAQVQPVQLTEQEEKAYRKSIHSRIPVKRDYSKMEPTVLSNGYKATNEVEVPDDMIFPNEADEVQAILMTWIYNTYTADGGAPAEAMFDGWGIPYTSSSNQLVPVVSSPVLLGTYPKLFAKLANGIQQHAQVWINIWNAQDSTSIKNYMQSLDMPLTNYRFFINPGNSFWYRDCGPVAFYYGDQDSIGFADFEYYGGRPEDDKIAIRIAEQTGYKVFTNTIEFEGGNILVDGLGTLFTTDAVYSLNQDQYGPYVMTANNTLSYIQKTPLTDGQVDDSLTHLMNLENCVVLPALRYDGGTGHIDLYVDMWDETTMVSTKHPDVMSHLSDPIIVQENIELMTNMESAFDGSNYYSTYIPLPAKNNGSWYSSQNEYHSQYTRSYSNHTFVNGAIMQPVFYDETMSGTAAGDIEGELHALQVIRDCYPGYELVEIDVRDFDGFGGAIHCITKQIPAENPLRIYHDPIRWSNSSVLPTYRAIIQNRSGIESATFYYKNKSATTWNEMALTNQSDNMYTVDLTLPETPRDTLVYYFSATSNNGKTLTKPMTAPNGYYSTVYGSEVNGLGVNDPYAVGIASFEMEEFAAIGQFYPNPATTEAHVTIPADLTQTLNVKVVTTKGQTVYNGEIAAGETNFKLNTSNLRAGAYWAVFYYGNQSVARKIVVVK